MLPMLVHCFLFLHICDAQLVDTQPRGGTQRSQTQGFLSTGNLSKSVQTLKERVSQSLSNAAQHLDSDLYTAHGVTVKESLMQNRTIAPVRKSPKVGLVTMHS
eukprot:gnl/MRDRNA2_/MRDRNA2_217364_c0_seq1.p1 gnl/MRDRNA2_/MRDRNA2_217364_c0~~gnl/MRDRNA2_/MRDRNA2_217364_c0_seq1.p1  ORF type:complete len:103 (+),score=5.96 gnl/MRDRNA2_/MRDRNA2_217364_c0_seq1:238-546(+)